MQRTPCLIVVSTLSTIHFQLKPSTNPFHGETMPLTIGCWGRRQGYYVFHHGIVIIFQIVYHSYMTIDNLKKIITQYILIQTFCIKSVKIVYNDSCLTRPMNCQQKYLTCNEMNSQEFEGKWRSIPPSGSLVLNFICTSNVVFFSMLKKLSFSIHVMQAFLVKSTTVVSKIIREKHTMYNVEMYRN